jgi:hypothetical protein
MPHRFTRRVAASLTVVAGTLCLTGCTLPFSTVVATSTVAPTPLPAAPSVVRPPLVQSGPPPALANTGSHWAPMLASMLTYGQWLMANPGMGVTATVATAGCPLTDLLTTRIADLAAEGWRLAPAPLTISSLGVPSRLASGQTTVDLQVVASRGTETVVDATGQPASGIAALPPATFDISLNLGGDGRWRLCTAAPAEPVQRPDGSLDSSPSLL